MRRRKIIIQSQRREADQANASAAVPVEDAPSWPLPDDDVRQALLAAYDNGAWGQYHGPHVERLQHALADFHSVEHALTCSSGTIAVEVALRAVKVSAGDEVILAGYDFAGNFRAIESIGARPVLVDLMPDSWCLELGEVAAALNERTRAVIVSHLHSSLAPIEEIVDIAHAHGVAVVEDACQAQGALVKGQLAGTVGDIGVWSFGGSKVITSGRGGTIFTNDSAAYQRAKVYCERGNNAFALSELQAAVLLPQLEKLSARNLRRQANAACLHAHLQNVPALIGMANRSPSSQPAFYKASWFYDDAQGGRPREAVVAAAKAHGVSLDTGFRGFVTRPDSRCRKIGPLPNARRAIEQTLLLHHPVLLCDEVQIAKVAEAIRDAMTRV